MRLPLPNFQELEPLMCSKRLDPDPNIVLFMLNVYYNGTVFLVITVAPIELFLATLYPCAIPIANIWKG